MRLQITSYVLPVAILLVVFAVVSIRWSYILQNQEGAQTTNRTTSPQHPESLQRSAKPRTM